MLHGALDIRPFFDGTWTIPSYNDTGSAGVPYPTGYAQRSVEVCVGSRQTCIVRSYLVTSCSYSSPASGIKARTSLRHNKPPVCSFCPNIPISLFYAAGRGRVGAVHWSRRNRGQGGLFKRYPCDDDVREEWGERVDQRILRPTALYCFAILSGHTHCKQLECRTHVQNNKLHIQTHSTCP